MDKKPTSFLLTEVTTTPSNPSWDDNGGRCMDKKPTSFLLTEVTTTHSNPRWDDNWARGIMQEDGFTTEYSLNLRTLGIPTMGTAELLNTGNMVSIVDTEFIDLIYKYKREFSEFMSEKYPEKLLRTPLNGFVG